MLNYENTPISFSTPISSGHYENTPTHAPTKLVREEKQVTSERGERDEAESTPKIMFTGMDTRPTVTRLKRFANLVTCSLSWMFINSRQTNAKEYFFESGKSFNSLQGVDQVLF